MNIEQAGIIIALFTQLIAFIIWLVRLEGRVNYGEKSQAQIMAEVKALEVKHDSLDSKIVQELAKLRESVARIEGLLQGAKEHLNR